MFVNIKTLLTFVFRTNLFDNLLMGPAFSLNQTGSNITLKTIFDV